MYSVSVSVTSDTVLALEGISWLSETVRDADWGVETGVDFFFLDPVFKNSTIVGERSFVGIIEGSLPDFFESFLTLESPISRSEWVEEVELDEGDRLGNCGSMGVDSE